MFNLFVRSLPIGREFTGLSIRDPYNLYPDIELLDREYNPDRALAEFIQVQDICEELPEDIPYYYPGFSVRGFYINGNQFNRIFRIDPCGNHILCFTGKPNGDNNNKFRLANTIYRYYWEDNNRGYITQVIEATRENLYKYHHNDY